MGDEPKKEKPKLDHLSGFFSSVKKIGKVTPKKDEPLKTVGMGDVKQAEYQDQQEINTNVQKIVDKFPTEAPKPPPIVKDKRTVIENGKMKEVVVETRTPQTDVTVETPSFDDKGSIKYESQKPLPPQEQTQAEVYNTISDLGIDNSSGMADVIGSVLTPIYTGLNQMEEGEFNEDSPMGRRVANVFLGAVTTAMSSIPQMAGVNTVLPAITQVSRHVAPKLGFTEEQGEWAGQMLAFAPFGWKVFLAGLTSETGGQFVDKIAKDMDLSPEDRNLAVQTAHHLGFFTGLTLPSLIKKGGTKVKDFATEKVTEIKKNSLIKEIEKVDKEILAEEKILSDNPNPEVQTLTKKRIDELKADKLYKEHTLKTRYNEDAIVKEDIKSEIEANDLILKKFEEDLETTARAIIEAKDPLERVKMANAHEATKDKIREHKEREEGLQRDLEYKSAYAEKEEANRVSKEEKEAYRDAITRQIETFKSDITEKQKGIAEAGDDSARVESLNRELKTAEANKRLWERRLKELEKPPPEPPVPVKDPTSEISKKELESFKESEQKKTDTKNTKKIVNKITSDALSVNEFKKEKKRIQKELEEKGGQELIQEITFDSINESISKQIKELNDLVNKNNDLVEKNFEQSQRETTTQQKKTEKENANESVKSKSKNKNNKESSIKVPEVKKKVSPEDIELEKKKAVRRGRLKAKEESKKVYEEEIGKGNSPDEAVNKATEVIRESKVDEVLNELADPNRKSVDEVLSERINKALKKPAEKKTAKKPVKDTPKPKEEPVSDPNARLEDELFETRKKFAEAKTPKERLTLKDRLNNLSKKISENREKSKEFSSKLKKQGLSGNREAKSQAKGSELLMDLNKLDVYKDKIKEGFTHEEALAKSGVNEKYTNKKGEVELRKEMREYIKSNATRAGLGFGKKDSVKAQRDALLKKLGKEKKGVNLTPSQKSVETKELSKKVDNYKQGIEQGFTPQESLAITDNAFRNQEIKKFNIKPEDVRRKGEPLDNKPTLEDKVWYGYYNGVPLSNPITLFRNLFGNASNFAWELMSIPFTQSLELTKKLPKDLLEAHYAGKEEALSIRKYGKHLATKYDVEGQHFQGEVWQPTSKVGKFVKGKLPLVQLASHDAYWRNLNGALRKRATVEEIRKETGESFDKVVKRMELIAKEPDLAKLNSMFEAVDKHTKALERFVDFNVFQTPFGEMGKKGQEFVNHSRIGKFVFMFNKIMVNLAKNGLRNSPLGFTDLLRKGKTETRLERNDVLRRALVGTAMWSGLAYLNWDGTIQVTGSGGKVDSQKERDLQANLGLKPNHFYITHKDGTISGTSYLNFPPSWSLPLAIIGNMNDDANYGRVIKDEGYAEKFEKFIWAMARTVSDQTFMDGLKNVIDLWEQKKSWGDFTQDLFTPAILGFPKKIKEIITKEAPIQRQLNNSGSTWDEIFNRWKNKIGMGLEEDLPMKLDYFGRPKKQPYNDLPFNDSDIATHDPIDKEIAGLVKETKDGSVIPSEVKPEFTYKEQDWKLNAKDHERFGRLVGKERYDMVKDLFENKKEFTYGEGKKETKLYKDMTTTERVDALRSIYLKGQEIGKEKYLGVYGEKKK